MEREMEFIGENEGWEVYTDGEALYFLNEEETVIYNPEDESLMSEEEEGLYEEEYPELLEMVEDILNEGLLSGTYKAGSFVVRKTIGNAIGLASRIGRFAGRRVSNFRRNGVGSLKRAVAYDKARGKRYFSRHKTKMRSAWKGSN